ncbi:LysR family transcriptional regulator [Burkholderia sp. A1]|uniref:LysR family transcriptional regulator n=1 Tax=Burkholderia sp. A1 TaxID=148446 RepID=UPI000468A6D7|nr:LysR family transcriptional regulator [Burkholderia sp. A1]
MGQKNFLDGVPVFVAVAEAGSFSEAARQLGISPSAASQAIRNLETRLGTPLLRRSTRSLSLTDEGARYFQAAAPALSQLRRAAEEAAGHGGRPTGALRLSMPRVPFDRFIAPSLAAFQQACPEVEIEIAVEGRMIDIVEQGFDAGLRYGNLIAKDMVAVPVGAASEAILVASPGYLRTRTTPERPDDLLVHRSVACRSQSTGLITPWVLQSAGRTVQMVPPAATVVHDFASQIALTVSGMGVSCAPLGSVATLLDAGKLARILSDWSTPLEALYLYFPSRRHQTAALRAFIAFLKTRPWESGGDTIAIE